MSPMIILLLVLSIIITASITFGIWQRRKERIALSLLFFALALFAWTIAFLLLLRERPDELFWLSPVFLCMALTSTALLVFTFDYTDHKQWLTRRGILLLAIEPVLIQILFWISYWQTFSPTQGQTSASVSIAPLQLINDAYCNGLAIASIILLIQSYSHTPKKYSTRTLIIAAGIIVPVVIRAFGSLSFLSFLNTTSNPWGYIITGLFIASSILIFKLPDLELISRETAVEHMTEGWIVLDTQNRIVDINPAAEALIEQSHDKILGQLAGQILKNWPNLYWDQAARDIEYQGSINVGGEWRYLEVSVPPLINSKNENVGRVILWRDITGHRKATEARQRARDEMFVLLRSISSAATRNMNLNEFLSDAIYQIVYSFHSRASAIFLITNDQEDTEKKQYYLAAHHGLAPQEVDFLSSAPEVTNLLEQMIESHQPFVLSDLSTNEHVPTLFMKANFKSLMIAPMIQEDKVVGMIGLARGEEMPYGTDEVARLTVVGEEIASLISSGRQRQTVIAMEERQRIVKDLHDSITQELCILVALTELAQANLESGKETHPKKTIMNIAEHARHALKEMRLFLFQMRPVDLEGEGLVSVLLQRLDTVEGLADAQARLITDDKVGDDKINLSLDKQEALYYIAQEALNNILKHAKPKHVTIHLAKRRGNIILEIQDDGCGFNLKKAAAKGSMGLRNMRDRAVAMGGKLRIVSAPGKGTTIKATIPQDK